MINTVAPTQGLTWGWGLLGVLTLACQTTLLLAVAPLLSGWIDRLAGRLTGEHRPWPMARWHEIRHQFRRPPLLEPADRAGGFVTRAAFLLAALGAVMVPVFSLCPAGFPAPGLLLVCGMLVLASLLLWVPLVLQPRTVVVPAYMAIVADVFLLPALVPVLVMVGGQDFSEFLVHIRTFSPLQQGAPFVLMGVALFGVAAWRGQQAGQALPCPLSGPDRGLWLWARDCIQLCWVTLAGDVAWPGALALPGDVGVESWLTACLLAIAAWGLKLGVAALLLATTQLVVLPLPRRGRVRLAAVFLLGLLAWQVAYPVLAPIPPTQDKTAQAESQPALYGAEDGATP
ncbi:hypothetical protein [Acetobacter orientalis]|uniref:hypothetical protein n=1 Tax=Acetobacter orientalis TaxID=146474 RepID=UPI0039EB8DAF